MPFVLIFSLIVLHCYPGSCSQVVCEFTVNYIKTIHKGFQLNTWGEYRRAKYC